MSQLREILSVWRGADDVGDIDWISAADELEDLLDQGAAEEDCVTESPDDYGFDAMDKPVDRAHNVGWTGSAT